MNTNRSDLSLLVLLVGVSVLLYFVFAPFVSVISLAAVFAIMLHRPFDELTKRFGGWKSFSAALTVVLMLIFFIVPLFFLGTQIFQEAQGMYALSRSQGSQYIETVSSAIQGPVRRVFPGFVLDTNTYVENTLLFISDNLGSLVYQTFSVIFGTFFMVLALFFFLRDGQSLLASIIEVSPLGSGVTREILDKMYETIRSVVQGTLLIILIRWVCLGIAFYFFHIPNAVLWSSVGAILGAVPGLGTAFAFVGAVAYLYLQGDVIPAFGLAAYGIAAVVLVDNILTSYFFGKGLDVSPIFVLFSILGGIVLFGPIGFVLGPLVLSIFLSVMRSYNLMEKKTVE